MSLIHLHLILNHVPVIGAGFALLLLLLGVLRKSQEIVKASLVFFVIIALIAIPVFLTGEPAEKTVEKLPGISKAVIGQHEEAADVALTAMEVVGGISLLGLIFFRRTPRLPQWFTAVVLVGALAAGGLMAYTANLGGKIRHTEISGATAGGPGVAQAEHDD